MTRISLAALAVALGATHAVAEPVTGVWKTEPDRKNLTSHIKIVECGDKVCGIIKDAFNAAGQKVMTPNVGKKLFWNLTSTGTGEYVDGTVWVPLMDIEARARMTLSGDTLDVTGCKGLICDGQTWTRVN
ncbi:MAG: DUF2147 domain-containing protein [Pseudomonadota bacterium]